MAQVLDGRVVAQVIKDSLKGRALSCRPCLGVILVGENRSSEIYVANKRRACEEIGVKSLFKRFSADVSHDQLIDWLGRWNDDQTVHGILVQLPLPARFDRNFILGHINPLKDVDCFHAENIGLLMQGVPRFCPCTPCGIVEIFKFYNIKPRGRHVAIINRSIVVGQPLAVMLTQDHEWGNATVTVCNEYTPCLGDVTGQADIVVTAVGRPDFRLTGGMVRDGAVVVDVGIYRDGNKIRGDVVFDEVNDKVGALTPVPGGCGPVTVSVLIKNTVEACERLRS